MLHPSATSVIGGDLVIHQIFYQGTTFIYSETHFNLCLVSHRESCVLFTKDLQGHYKNNKQDGKLFEANLMPSVDMGKTVLSSTFTLVFCGVTLQIITSAAEKPCL